MSCACFEGEWQKRPRFDIERVTGTDARYAEITIERCTLCHSRWLHYLVEEEGISRSGRWFRGLISTDTNVTAASAAQLLASLDWYWAGGSYFDGETHRRSGPLV